MNPHAAQTIAALNVIELPYTESEALAAVQAQAVLALSYEQHTANLIALAELKRKDRVSGPTSASTELIMAIEERLGIL